jgi:hypothetical protein
VEKGTRYRTLARSPSCLTSIVFLPEGGWPVPDPLSPGEERPPVACDGAISRDIWHKIRHNSEALSRSLACRSSVLGGKARGGAFSRLGSAMRSIPVMSESGGRGKPAPLEIWSRLAAVRPLLDHGPRLLAALYVFGFVVVNHYMASFAVASPNLFEGRYLSAGLLFVVVAGAPMVSAQLAFLSARRSANGPRSRVARIAIVITVFALLQVTLWIPWSQLLMALIAVDGDPRAETRFFISVSLAAVSLLFVLRDLGEFWAADTYHWWNETLLRGVYSVILLLAILIYFAGTIYPRVAPEYGGGAAPAGRVILKPGTTAMDVGLPPTQRAVIVDQRDGFLRLLICPDSSPNGPRRISVPADVVLSVVNEPGNAAAAAVNVGVVGLGARMCSRRPGAGARWLIP